MTRLGYRTGLWLFCALLLAAPLRPASAGITVEQYQQSFLALKKLESLPEMERIAYMSAHRAELAEATQIQEQAAMVYETILAANDASFERYRRSLLCNFEEEDQPVTFQTLVEDYVTELRDHERLGQTEISAQLRDTPFADLIVDKMLARFQCPLNFPTGPAAVSNLDVPPASPTPIEAQVTAPAR